jgi:hypothetical protein
MEKFSQKIKENFHYVIGFFILINLFDSCRDDNKKLEKKITKLQVQVDSMQNAAITAKQLHIEGLLVEKRMIQSVDRKLFDLQREKEIDRELLTLNK